MAPRLPTTRVLRGTITYAAAAVSQRTIGFLLLPLYARVLSPAEYGQIGVLTTITAALGALLGLGLETAVFRSYVRLRDQPVEQTRFINTVGAFVLVVPLVVAVVAAVGLSSPMEAWFNVPRSGVALGFVGAALAIAATVVPLAVLRAQERLRDYVRLSGVQVLVTVGLTFGFVVILRWGVLGWMLALACSAGILLLRGLAVLGHRWSRDLDPRHLAAALAFGLPMVPHALAHWGLSLSDRAILAAFLDSAEVGIYYVAYQFGMPISVIAIALTQAVQPLYAEASLADDRHPELARSASHQVVTTGFLTMAVALLGPPAVLGFLPGSYAAAAPLIPWIALGHGLFGLYFVPMNAITLLSGRNQWVWIVTVTAALANVGLNLLFVPRIGATAAAVNTAVGYAILLVGVSVYMHRIVDQPVRFEWSRISLGLIIIVAAAIAAVVISPVDPVLALLTRGATVLLVAIVLAAVGQFGIPSLRTKRCGRLPLSRR